jgi:predicted 2-oxoglutarate/Fe(II)-dependent dioxygenase YbiX
VTFGLIDVEQPLYWTVDDVLGDDEIEALIAHVEAAPREVAPINAAEGVVHRPEVRNNTRLIFDDAARAAALWERLRAHVPPRMFGAEAVGLNERFRAYRYEAGQRFGPHYDGAFVRDARERSCVTVLLYLNEGMTGGETTLIDLGASFSPRRGQALFFQHRLLHEGAEVSDGLKYVLRTDVMYRLPDLAGGA